MNKMNKTNVMRMLDKAGISYVAKEYAVDQDLSGSHAADILGEDHRRIFKTLVLKGEKTGYLVCCIPVDQELDLKKTAKAAKDKKTELIPMKDLQAVTGYVRGGCSPIGMKKRFPTYIDETAALFDEIAVSAGIRGIQIFISPNDLKDFIGAGLVPLTADSNHF